MCRGQFTEMAPPKRRTATSSRYYLHHRESGGIPSPAHFLGAPVTGEGPNEVGARATRTRVDPIGERERAPPHRAPAMAATDSPGGANIAEPGEMPAESGPSFRFEARRARLDWRLLHSVDVDRLMRENDLDMLETTLVRARPNLPPTPVAPRGGRARDL